MRGGQTKRAKSISFNLEEGAKVCSGKRRQSFILTARFGQISAKEIMNSLSNRKLNEF